jgi:hypothetical protein
MERRACVYFIDGTRERIGSSRSRKTPASVDVFGMLLSDARSPLGAMVGAAVAAAAGDGAAVGDAVGEVAAGGVGAGDAAVAAFVRSGVDVTTGVGSASGTLALPLVRSSAASARSTASRASSPAMKNARAADDAGIRARQLGQKLERASKRVPQAAQRMR